MSDNMAPGERAAWANGFEAGEAAMRKEFEPVRTACRLFEQACYAWMDRALAAEAKLKELK